MISLPLLGNIYGRRTPSSQRLPRIRPRTAKTRSCVARHTTLAIVDKLGQSAHKKWRRLRGFKLLAERIRGVQFKDGERIAPLQEVSLATLHLAKEKANKLSSLPQAETNRKTAFSQVSLSPLYFGPVDIPG